MHIKGVSPAENTKMSGCSVDSRLRRQSPMSIRQRPPRLRVGGRIAAPSNKDQSVTDHTRHQKTKSWHGSGHLPSEFSRGDDVSKSKSFANDPNDHVSNISDTSFNRPLMIHHQRHNLKNRFHLVKTLGEGTYGKVKLATECSTGEQVAIKYIKKTKIHDEADLTRIRREIQILSSLKHNHIVNIREVFERKDKIVLVMDYAQGGELYDYLNKAARLTEVEARRIFRQIVSAIHYCHQNGIVHRDLKLENIILDDGGNVKIADFGLANYYSFDKTLETFCGSPLYASPEIVNGKFYHGPEVDVWSLGVILYTLVYGAMPFESNSLVSLKQQISQGNYAQPSQPSDAAGLIRHMLTVTPSRRASMEDALCHWWVNFGHSLMPNGVTYNPDQESHTRRSNTTGVRPRHAHSLSAPVVSSTSTAPQAPTTFIHQRNQSSISSDSDLELDFKPSRWYKSANLDKSSRQSPSTDGNSSSSSSSFACSTFTDEPDNFTKDVSDLVVPDCEVPQAVMEIFKDCSSKTLACLLGSDKISTGFDLTQQSVTSISTNSLPEKTDSDKVNLSVFDSERKPKRGILKRKGKFSGGDSGCAMPEEMSVRAEESYVPKSGNLPKRLPSFRGEAHGIFASKHRISQLLQGETEKDNYNSAMPQSEDISSECYNQTPSANSQQQQQLKQPQQQQEQLQQDDDDQYLLQQQQLNSSSSLYDITSSRHVQDNQSILHPALDTNLNHPLPIPAFSALPSRISTTNLRKTTSSSTPCLNLISQQPPPLTTSTPTPHNYSVHNDSIHTNGVSNSPFSRDTTKVIRRPKSILKASKSSQLEEARNRLSVSSIGSNSSADFLDLSYDSGDSDHYTNLRNLSSPDDIVNAETSPPDSIYGEDRPSLCLDEDFENMNTAFRDVSIDSPLLEPRNSLEMVTAEKAEIQIIPTTTQAIFSEVESPMLYRLTREAKDLTLQ